MWTHAARSENGLPSIREVARAAAHRKMERHTAEHAARMRGPARHPAPLPEADHASTGSEPRRA